MMEDALDGVKAYFDASLETALTAIETARSVTIPRIVGGIATRTDLSYQFPKMSLLPRGVNHEYGDTDAPLKDFWSLYDIDIVITHTGSDYDTVQDALCRYYEAIVNMTIASWTYGGRFDQVILGDLDFSEMLEAQEDGRLLQSLFLSLEVRAYEH